MDTKERPRKPLYGNEDFSINQLATIPLKRKLEILFVSNIIPSRRQLALKYELPEQIIHNVLSHRKYLLENWKYNAKEKPFLSKLELENAMALSELLIEWKRRVELNGLQITDTALTRKAIFLQQMLNDKDEGLNTRWWDLFEVNCMYKKFQEYGSDSLDMEDILNDLQWMFSESTFERLTARFRQAKNRLKSTVGLANARRTELPAIVAEQDLLHVSDIHVDPNYYNDDDFECEDYEFVLDEEVMLDSLRKELEDIEQAKFQQYLLGSLYHDGDGGRDGDVDGDGEFNSQDEVHVKHEPIPKEQEHHDEFLEVDQSSPIIIVEPHIPNDLDDVDHDIERKMNFICEQVNSAEPIMFDDIFPKHENSQEFQSIKNEFVNSLDEPPVVDSGMRSNPTVTQSAPLKRKPRDMNAVLSLRKDYVRLPAPYELASLARRQCLEQLLQDSEESNEDIVSIEEQKRGRRKKNEQTKLKTTPIRRSYKPKPKRNLTSSRDSPSVSESFTTELMVLQHNADDMGIDFDITDSDLKPVFTFDSYDGVKAEMVSDLEHFIVEPIEIIGNIAELNTSSCSNAIDSFEQNNNDAEKVINNQYNISEEPETKITRRVFKKKPSQRTLKQIPNHLEEDLMLGDDLTLAFENNYQPTKMKSGLDIETEIAGTAIQTKERLEDSDSQSSTSKQPITSAHRLTKGSNKKGKRVAKGQPKQQQNQRQKNVNPKSNANPIKRAKRRTDASDLTLRKDKVRLTMIPMMSDRGTSSRRNAIQASEVQMVFEPYMGDG